MPTEPTKQDKPEAINTQEIWDHAFPAGNLIMLTLAPLKPKKMGTIILGGVD